MALLKKIKQTGLVYSFGIAFNRVVPQWLFRCRRFVIYQLDPQLIPKNAIDPQNDTIQVSWCESESDYSAAEALTYFRRTLSTGNQRACVAKLSGDPPSAAVTPSEPSQLAAGFWVATQQFDESELGVRIVLKPAQAWLFAAYVAQPFRRRGIYSQVLAFIVAQLTAENFKQLLVAVNPQNVGSNSVHQQFAARTIGTVFAMRVLTTSVCFTTGDLKKERSLALNSKRRPIAISVDV